MLNVEHPHLYTIHEINPLQCIWLNDKLAYTVHTLSANKMKCFLDKTWQICIIQQSNETKDVYPNVTEQGVIGIQLPTLLHCPLPERGQSLPTPLPCPLTECCQSLPTLLHSGDKMWSKITYTATLSVDIMWSNLTTSQHCSLTDCGQNLPTLLYCPMTDCG